MVTINGNEFELYNYQTTPSGIRMTINGSTTSELERVIGNSANIAISDEYRGYGLKIASMFKRYGTPVQHEIEFVDQNMTAAIQQNAAEIELNAEAIAELADIIAGGE